MMLAMRDFAAAPFAELQRELNRAFDGFLGRDAFGGARPFPALNLWDDGERVLVEAELPGLEMNDIELLIQGDELTIKGHRKPAADSESAVYHRQERGVGEFARYMTLPVEVDAERVEATLKNGVLTILMPKAERARARKITVKTT